MLVDFTIDPETLTDFGRRFRSAKKKKVGQALSEIQREWQAEFRRQHTRLQSTWTPLKRVPKGKSYYARKTRDYHSGKIPFNSILKRTGKMLAGYIGGIRVDAATSTVEIPFPAGARIRAEVHQGERQLPRGVLAHRPFETDKFVDKAYTILETILDE